MNECNNHEVEGMTDRKVYTILCQLPNSGWITCKWPVGGYEDH